jgi:hypothetical protein
MKILVCGGRDYHNQKRIEEVLNGYNDVEAIRQGAGKRCRFALLVLGQRKIMYRKLKTLQSGRNTAVLLV